MQSRLALASLDVPVTTIDEFCRQNGIGEVALAKFDIESLEPQAIRGMRRTIERSRPHLFVEILDGKGTAGALDALAKEFGYNVFALELDDAHFLQRIDTSPLRRNFLFTAMSAAELEIFMNTHTRTRTRSMKAHNCS
jgi:hypothetical protein